MVRQTAECALLDAESDAQDLQATFLGQTLSMNTSLLCCAFQLNGAHNAASSGCDHILKLPLHQCTAGPTLEAQVNPLRRSQ